MDFSGPDAIDKAIEAGLDLDGSQIPVKMLNLYREVMDKEEARKRSGVKNQCGIELYALEQSTSIKTRLISGLSMLVGKV